jgi:membrane protease subunit HflK
MPWDDNDNSKPKDQQKMESPWGGKPSNNNNDFEQLFKTIKDKLKKFNGPSQHNNRNFILAAVAILFFWLASGFYNISQEEEAVVLRFGKFVRLANPGLNYHIPEPIEKVISHKVDRVEEEQIGFRAGVTGNNLSSQRSLIREIPEESLMLTGDENIVDIHYTVQWNIKDVKDFVFNLQKPKDTVRNAAESAMREVIGNSPIMAAFEERSNIEFSAREILQNILDLYKSGIHITNFSIQDADPPAEVADAFRDVQTALADKEREINQAQAYQNDIIPRARGEAAKRIQESEGYKQGVVAIATGEVSRFNAIYAQYKVSKEVTKQRLYLETMEDILQNVDKIILDKNIEKNVLPYLPLNKLDNK